MCLEDYVADLAAEEFNVNWQRTSPVGFSLCNDYNCLYITGESDHSMGMTVAGNAEDVWKFRFTCSFAYSLLEQLVGTNIWKDHNIGSVTLGLLQRYMNNESLELIYENGYYFLKVYGDNASLLVFDPVTGLVRDIYRINGLLGSMPCYHDGITDNAIAYANLLLNDSLEVEKLNFLFIVSNSCSIIGECISEISTINSVSLIEFEPIIISVIGILVGFQIISPFLADICRDNSLYSLAEFYDFDLNEKIWAWLDYYLYQDGLIMKAINESNTNFYNENPAQIQFNQEQYDDIIKDSQRKAFKLYMMNYIIYLNSKFGGPGPDKKHTLFIIIVSYLFATSNLKKYFELNDKATNIYPDSYYYTNLNISPNYNNSIVINQTIIKRLFS